MSNAELTQSGNERDLIIGWLMENGWRIAATSSPNARWVVSAEDPVGRHVTLFLPADRPDMLNVVSGLILSDSHKARFNALPPNQRDDLIYELRQQTILLGVGYIGIGIPLEVMFFEEIVYLDQLSKAAILHAIQRARSGSILARTIIARRFNEPPPPEAERPALGFRPSGGEST